MPAGNNVTLWSDVRKSVQNNSTNRMQQFHKFITWR